MRHIGSRCGQGEVAELKSDLNSLNKDAVKEAVKKVSPRGRGTGRSGAL